MGSQSVSQICLLHLLGHVLNIAHSTLLLAWVGGDGLGSILALGVGAGGLPTRGLFGCRLGCGSWGSTCLGRRHRRGSCGRGSGRGGCSALVCCRRSSCLREWHDRPGTGSGCGCSSAGPSHGLRRRSWLRSSWLDGLGSGLGNRSRAGIRWLFWLLQVFLRELLRKLLGGSLRIGWGRLLDFGLVDLLGLGEVLRSITIDISNVLRGSYLLKLLGNDIHFQAADFFAGFCVGVNILRRNLNDGLLLGGLGFLGSSIESRRSSVLTALFNVSQDVIQNKISRRLLRKNKCLDKLLGLCSLVGRFADDLNNDVVEGSLGIDIGDSNLAVLEIELLDAFLDSLRSRMSVSPKLADAEM